VTAVGRWAVDEFGAVVARINDVGGIEGFGPVDASTDHVPFHADWEARVFAITSALLADGVYALDEFRDAIERMPPTDYLAASYYERWFHAVTTLLVERGVIDGDDLSGVLAAGDPQDG
jgi:hypothetical protein